MDSVKIAGAISIGLLILALIITAYYYRSSRAEMLQKQQEQCQKDIASLDNDIAKSLDDIDKLSRLSPKLKQKLEEQAAELQKLHEELQKIKTELDLKIDTSNDAPIIKSFQSQILDLSVKISELEAAKKDALAANAAANAALEAATAELDNIKSTKTTIQATNEATTAAAVSAEAARTAALCDEKITLLTAEKQNLVKELEGKIAIQSTRANAAESALVPLKTSLNEKEQVIAAANEKIQQITAELSKVSDLRSAAESTVNKLYSDFKMRGGDYTSKFPDAKYLNIFKTTANSEISGSDLGNWSDPANFNHPSPEACAERCFKNSDCRAFTYDKEWPSPYEAGKKGYCSMKTTAQISGTMAGRDVYRI